MEPVSYCKLSSSSSSNVTLIGLVFLYKVKAVRFITSSSARPNYLQVVTNVLLLHTPP